MRIKNNDNNHSSPEGISADTGVTGYFEDLQTVEEKVGKLHTYAQYAVVSKARLGFKGCE